MLFTIRTTSAVLCICLFIGLGSARADTVFVSVCASMTDVFKELTANFSKSHPDINIQTNFGPSGALAKQIEQGAPADLFVSANSDWMDYLVGQKLVDERSRMDLARNRLVFIGRPELTGAAPDTLSGLNQIAIGNPAHVPAGQYAQQALTKLSLYDALKRQKKLVMAKDVRQALIYADRGEVDGAFVYATDARLSRTAVIHFTVDDSLHAPIVYPLGLTADGSNDQMARRFYDYLMTPETGSVLNRYGFEQVFETDRQPAR